MHHLLIWERTGGGEMAQSAAESGAKGRDVLRTFRPFAGEKRSHRAPHPVGRLDPRRVSRAFDRKKTGIGKHGGPVAAGAIGGAAIFRAVDGEDGRGGLRSFFGNAKALD